MMQNIPYKLKLLRDKNGYSQEEIAEILGVTQQTYCNYEIGKHEIPVRHVVKLSELYKITSDYLLGLSLYMTTPPELNKVFYNKMSYGEYVELLLPLSKEDRKSVISFTKFLLSNQRK